nr:ribosome maturation factor RimM [Caldimonas brevitalea]
MPTSSADDVVWPEDAVEVGRIVDAWGIKGWLKVQPYSSDPQALFSSRRWFIKPSEGPSPGTGKVRTGAPRLLKITQAKDHGDVVVAAVQDIDDRNGAESLKGWAVFISRASFPTADADEFYWVDLIGLAVVNRQGERLGAVADLLDTGAHSVLRVLDETQAEPVERLIPFVAAYIDKVDQTERVITVDWGLDY